jgi:hypothetical protein
MIASDNSSSNQPGVDELISTNEAASISGFSQEHIALLLRKGEIWGKKIGRNWVTTKRAVQEYLARDRRPGPKTD